MKVPDLFAQPFVGQHFGARINVINAIQFVQGNGVAKEVIAFESGIDAKNAFATLGALNVVEKNCNDRNFTSQKFGQKKFVEKNFVYAGRVILSARFQRERIPGGEPV